MIQDKCYNVHQDLRYDFNTKDLVRNDENDDTTGTTKDKNDLLHSDSKMESDSLASNDDNQKSDDDDGKQDVVMDKIDEQNKEDVCKEDTEAVELSSSIKRCGHPMKHSYHLDVKDVNEPIAEKINNEDQDAEEIPFEFADRKDEQTVHNADTSKNNLNEFSEIINIEDSESEKEEFDFGRETDNEEKYDPIKDADYKDEFYKSPYELKPIEPKIRVSASEILVADTLFVMMYKPREIVFETYEGFKVSAIEMEMAIGLDVHYEVINAWCDVLNTIEKDRKDDDKTARKTGFLHFCVICFDLQSGSLVLIENNCIENDSAGRDLGIPNALHRSYKNLQRAKLEVVKLEFKKKNDHADCGIIVMTAMDCYIGEVKKLMDVFLEGIPYTQLVNLRQMIAIKIMMSKINIRKNVYQRRIKSNSKKKNIDSFVCNDYDDSIDEVDPNIILKEVIKDINKSSAEYTEDNSNDEDNEDSHSAEEEQNTEDSDSVKTLRGRPKKSNDKLKKQTIGSNKKGREYKEEDDNDNDGTKRMKKKMDHKEAKVKRKRDQKNTKRKIVDESSSEFEVITTSSKGKKHKKNIKISDENKKNIKIRTRTTPTTLFNAMAILNVDRKKCLYEIGFGSMIGMAIHELLGMLGFYVIDNLDTKTNVLSLTDNSILVTSQSMHDILGIPMGGCSLESLASRSPDDPFIKE
nr:hypothetical protein [Tanacetum cinerariifolium]